MKIALLTGGSDKPYAFGLLEALVAKGVTVEVIGSNELSEGAILADAKVTFFNFRGDTDSSVTKAKKIARILKYYVQLVKYAANRQPLVFHILWANRFFFLDRILINAYYKLMGKKLAFTAHNVNERRRDGCDSFYNRFTLKALYTLVDHVFVHTEFMKSELISAFGIDARKVSVIPFGINNTLPKTELDRSTARAKLSLGETEKVLLFFGRVAKYKGLEYAIEALDKLVKKGENVRLVVAGRIEEGCGDYWRQMEAMIDRLKLGSHVIKIISFIPDQEVEIFFKSADALVLPYRAIFQSGVLFLAYSFGLPVIASDVGSFKDDITEGKTGMVFRAEDAEDFAYTIERYFCSALFDNLEQAREDIMDFGNSKYSWETVAEITCAVYDELSSDKGCKEECRERSVL